MDASSVVWFVWFGGIIIYAVTARFRARVRFGERVYRTHGAAGMWWAIKQAVCALVWPVAIVVWFVRGRPEAATRFRS